MRTLTPEQHDRLGNLPPETRVIGWYNNGPIIHPRGSVLRYLDVSGRVRILPKAGRETLTKQEEAA